MKRLGIACAAFVLLSACGGGSGRDEEVAAKPKTFDVSGTMTLSSTNVIGDGGNGCLGSDGYDDMRPGASVVVLDEAGRKIGIGELETGYATTKTTCVFGFNVTDVPVKGSIYSIEVANRGEVPFKKSDASRVALTLG